jgi:putative transcriptional regulator
VAKTLPFTNNVKALRECNNGITQAGLGELVGVTRQTIIAIEQGRYSPSLETAFRIAKVFNVDLEDVFHWTL